MKKDEAQAYYGEWKSGSGCNMNGFTVTGYLLRRKAKPRKESSALQQDAI